MRICLFEDRHADDLAPLTLTRPTFDLLCGLSPLAEKHARYFAPDATAYLVRPLVADLVRAAHPHAPVNDSLWLRSGQTVLVNARWIPPAGGAEGLFTDGPFLAVCDGELAFAAVGPELLAGVFAASLDECLEDWLTALPRQEVGGFMVRRLWDLVDRNGKQILADFPALIDPATAGFRPEGVAVVGPAERLFLDPSATVDPMVVIDTTGGPVVIGAGAVVTAFTRLEGPCAIGPGTHVLGTKVRAGTTIGPHCRIGGEVEASIVQGYANKAHEGFLGHSFVGEWVNLAAGTQTSDLRNDYRAVSVPTDGATANTGRLKVGSFFGDHAKTALGVLLNCGSVFGAFAGVLPTGKLAARDVPSFTRFGSDGLVEDLNFDALFATADTVMKRRRCRLTRTHESLYRAVAAQTAAHRRRVVSGDGLATRRLASQ
jgi:UDP-N-acetylglucosamine diphosphorylase/glucosamine-1-phosphate N-acetyltransferase